MWAAMKANLTAAEKAALRVERSASNLAEQKAALKAEYLATHLVEQTVALTDARRVERRVVLKAASKAEMSVD